MDTGVSRGEPSAPRLLADKRALVLFVLVLTPVRERAQRYSREEYHSSGKAQNCERQGIIISDKKLKTKENILSFR
jgi:hypothetical protein